MASVSVERHRSAPLVRSSTGPQLQYGSMQTLEAASIPARPRSPAHTTHSFLSERRMPPFLRAPAPTPPTWAESLVTARPEASIDHSFDKAVQGCSRISYSWLTTPAVRARPAVVLGLFACTGAAVACATGVAGVGKRVRRAVVDQGLRQGTAWLQARASTQAAVPAAIVCDTVALSITVTADTLAVASGVLACVSAPAAAVPLIWMMSSHMREALADGLCSYLKLNQRLQEVEALFKRKGTRSAEAEAVDADALNLAYGRLRAQIDSLTATGPNAPEPEQAHFQFVMGAALTHPQLFARLGLPPSPGPERLQPALRAQRGRFGMGRRQPPTPTVGGTLGATTETMR